MKSFYPIITDPLDHPYDVCNPTTTSEPVETTTTPVDVLPSDTMTIATTGSPPGQESATTAASRRNDRMKEHTKPTPKFTETFERQNPMEDSRSADTTSVPRVKSTTFPKMVNNAIYKDLSGARHGLPSLALVLALLGLSAYLLQL